MKFYDMWPPRLAAALRAEGVESWEDIANLSITTLLGYKGVGSAAIQRLSDDLDRRGLAFSSSAKWTRPKTVVSEPARCGVYFVRCVGFIKIGRAANIRQRVKNASTFCPFPLELLRIVECATDAESVATEKALHRQFASLRYQGEWFHDTGELRAFLDSKATAAA